MMMAAAEDIEAGTRERPKFQTEPTLPIYLKVTYFAIRAVSEFSFHKFFFLFIFQLHFPASKTGNSYQQEH